MRRISYLIILLTGLIFFTGCLFTRTVYVPYNSAVRLRQDVRGVDVWAKDDTGASVAGQIDLKEGWYCLSDPGVRK